LKEEIFQNLSFKTGKTLQWVVEGIVSDDSSERPDGTGLFGKW